MAVIVENQRTLYHVVVQDRTSLQVLMVAYADHEALSLTRSTGYAHFYSRSRHTLWKKGESSGHVLPVAEILTDCDEDTYLYLADAIHPVCHLNRASCFGPSPEVVPDGLTRLSHIVADRMTQADPETSYTARLVQGPLERLLKKIGEESVEVVLAAALRAPNSVIHEKSGADKDDLVWETVDLLYHLAVLLNREDISMDRISQEIERRHQSPTQG